MMVLSVFVVTVSAAEQVLYEDDFGFRTIQRGGTGNKDLVIADETTEVNTGSNSVQFSVTSGIYGWVNMRHDFSPPSRVDWSAYDTLEFYWYGQNTGVTIPIQINTALPNGFTSLDLVDNFDGWQRIVLPFSSFTSNNRLLKVVSDPCAFRQIPTMPKFSRINHG